MPDDPTAHRYGKGVRSGRTVVGAILIGWPTEAPAPAEVVKQNLDLAHLIPLLREGQWSGLMELVD